jgi:hypothetical protein
MMTLPYSSRERKSRDPSFSGRLDTLPGNLGMGDPEWVIDSSASDVLVWQR